MLSPSLNPSTLRALWLKLARFTRERRGVAAVEFAFLAPILLMMYFLSMEASQAIEANKKVSRLGSMVADLVAQTSGGIDKAAIQNIMDIGQTTLLPYNRSKPTITVTGVQIDAKSQVSIEWSRKLENGVFGPGMDKTTKITIPSALVIPNTFLVKVDSELVYEPVITWSQANQGLGFLSTFAGIKMSESYLLRPRTVAALACSDC